MTAPAPIMVSSLDMDRIEALLEKLPRLTPELEKLEHELDRATVVAPQELPANVVSMNSTVRFKFAGVTAEVAADQTAVVAGGL